MNENPPKSVIKVPLEFLKPFLDDPESAARDWLAVPRPSISPFFRSIDKISDCIKDYKNPLNWKTYALDSSLVAKDDHQRFMHIDLSTRRDAVGISMCFVHSFTQKTIKSPDGSFSAQPMPIIKFDFVGRLSPRPEFSEREINYEAILAIILDLDSRGFNLRGGIISFDRFQSHWLLMTLKKEGFICTLLSIDYTRSKKIIDFDRPPDYIRKEPITREPSACYVLGRDLFYQDRMILPSVPLWYDKQTNWLEREAMGTMWDESNQRAVKGEGEVDDLLQSILGSAFHAHNNASTPPLDQKELTHEEDSSYYEIFTKGDNALGIEGRPDLASSEDMIDPELGYVPDDNDPEFQQLQDKFLDMVG